MDIYRRRKARRENCGTSLAHYLLLRTTILRVIAQKHFYLGPSGSGAMMKLVVNTSFGIGMRRLRKREFSQGIQITGAAQLMNSLRAPRRVERKSLSQWLHLTRRF
jgi:hypothetical protein